MLHLMFDFFPFLSNSAEHSYGSSMVSSKDGDESKR